jgi:hypothetical protein
VGPAGLLFWLPASHNEFRQSVGWTVLNLFEEPRVPLCEFASEPMKLDLAGKSWSGLAAVPDLIAEMPDTVHEILGEYAMNYGMHGRLARSKSLRLATAEAIHLIGSKTAPVN